jgi:hypothetical protein
MVAKVGGGSPEAEGGKGVILNSLVFRYAMFFVFLVAFIITQSVEAISNHFVLVPTLLFVVFILLCARQDSKVFREHVKEVEELLEELRRMKNE